MDFKAILLYCLSWFVPPSGLEDGLNSYVFPPIIFAKRERLDVVPVYLESLFYRLDEATL